MAKEDKEVDKFVFSKDIDSSISGFTLVFTFLLVGLFLQFNENFFGIATTFVKVIFVLLGLIGLSTEINNLNSKLQIKGFDNISFGVFFLIVVYLISIIDSSSWFKFFIICLNVVIFILFFIMIYFFCWGLIQITYSIILLANNNSNKKRKVFSRILVVLTQLGGIALMIAQIYDIFSK